MQLLTSNIHHIIFIEGVPSKERQRMCMNRKERGEETLYGRKRECILIHSFFLERGREIEKEIGESGEGRVSYK